MAIAVSAAVALVLASAAALRVYKQASKAPESIVSAQSAPATAAPPVAESDVKKGRPAPPSSASGKPGPGRAETTVLPTEVGRIRFAIIPWGEVYVDGRYRGVSPPLREVEVAAGRHKIEVRNTSFPVHTEVVDARPGGQARVRHRFQ